MLRLLLYSLLSFSCFSTLLAQSDSLSANYVIKRLPFNTKLAEFSPVPFQKGLIYVANHRSEVVVTHMTHDNEFLYDFYFVSLDSADSLWGKPRLLAGNLNSLVHEGPLTIGKDSVTMYFTRNLVKLHKNKVHKRDNNHLGIFKAEYREGKWVETDTFPYNNQDHRIAHPSLSADGKRLYFSADLPDTHGGADIYYSDWENDRWGEPQNLGPSINTKASELFPHIHESGILYFASEGHGSLGGLDIFYSVFSQGEWSSAINPGPPINTKDDDFGLFMFDNLKSGYLSSNRGRTKKDDDIYYFDVPLPEFSNCDTFQYNSYCYEFFEKNTTSLEGMPLSFEWVLGDGTSVRALKTDHCYADTGTYIISLNVIDSLTGDVYFQEATYTLKVENIQQLYINSPDTVRLSQDVSFDAFQTNLESCFPKEYYWETPDGTNYLGPEMKHQFAEIGEYYVRLGTISKDSCRKCAVKKIVVLEELDEKQIAREERKKDRKNRKEKKNEDASEEEEVLVKTSEEKPADTDYTVKLLETEDRLPKESTLFDSLEVLGHGSVIETLLEHNLHFLYTLGHTKNLTDLYPIFRDVKKTHFDSAIVVVSPEELDKQFDSTEVVYISDTDTILIVADSLLVSGQDTALIVRHNPDVTSSGKNKDKTMFSKNPLFYQYFFNYGKAKLDDKTPDFQNFLHELATAIDQRGQVQLFLEASASYVPIKGMTNQELAQRRAEKAKQTIKGLLKKHHPQTDVEKVIFVKTDAKVQGPIYKEDHYVNKHIYEKYQYVRVSRVK